MQRGLSCVGGIIGIRHVSSLLANHNERWGVLVPESTGLIVHSLEGARGIMASKKVQEKRSHTTYIPPTSFS
jgi:hypothetical protein